MLSPRALKNIEKTKRWANATPNSEPTKIVECDEDSQVYNWQRTHKKAKYKTFIPQSKKNKKTNK